MAKKTLKQKINCLKWSALLFAITYFVVGAILISDGPKFDLGKAYELIRDSLTLTAYLLTPLTALVLFSDWREPYLAGIKDEVQTKLDALEFNIRRQLFMIRVELSSQKFDEEDYKITNEDLFEKMNEFKNNIKRLERLGFADSNYVKNMKETHENFQTLKQHLDLIYYFLKKSLESEADQELLKFDDGFKIVQEFVKSLNNWELEPPK